MTFWERNKKSKLISDAAKKRKTEIIGRKALCFCATRRFLSSGIQFAPGLWDLVDCTPLCMTPVDPTQKVTQVQSQRFKQSRFLSNKDYFLTQKKIHKAQLYDTRCIVCTNRQQDKFIISENGRNWMLLAKTEFSQDLSNFGAEIQGTITALRKCLFSPPSNMFLLK